VLEWESAAVFWLSGHPGVPAPPNGVIPAKAGIHGSGTELVAEWIPAFAGMTNERVTLFELI